MKKRKTISLLLIASMLMSMSGCSAGQKKKVLETAEEYADAVISGDIGDIAEFMEDDDEFEEAMSEFMDNAASNESLEDIYDFIIENTSYEIDEKSVEVKDKKASVEITYTMVDYIDVYDDLDDDADIDDYLEALEDATDNTMEIDQEIELKLDKDEWKVVDDDNENILEVYGFYTELTALGWGGTDASGFTIEHFQEAISDILGDNDPYLFDGTTFDDCYGYGNGVSAQLEVYAYPDTAPSEFELAYGDWEEIFNNGDFDGNYSNYYDGTSGYAIFNGTSDATDSFYTGYYYGGIYLIGDCYFMVYTLYEDEEHQDLVDELLNEFGCTCPQR